jgi:membrane protein YdbS with pleckstrin-like domain
MNIDRDEYDILNFPFLHVPDLRKSVAVYSKPKQYHHIQSNVVLAIAHAVAMVKFDENTTSSCVNVLFIAVVLATIVWKLARLLVNGIS